MKKDRYGILAAEGGFADLPLEALKSAAGWYIGTRASGLPVSRESVEYFDTEQEARSALDSGAWTQRRNP